MGLWPRFIAPGVKYTRGVSLRALVEKARGVYRLILGFLTIVAHACQDALRVREVLRGVLGG